MFKHIELLKQKNYKPTIIFDIGAYHGLWTRNMLSIYPESKYYLYEAIARVFRTSYTGASNCRPLISRIDKIIRYTIHMMEVERPRPPNYERRNEDLRVRYLMNEITEEDMRDQLQKDDKRHHKNQELADIYTLLGTTVTDILFRFSNQLDRDKNTRPDRIDDSMLNEIDRIVDYANECLSDVPERWIEKNQIHNLCFYAKRSEEDVFWLLIRILHGDGQEYWDFKEAN
jgi:hypothetical protein